MLLILSVKYSNRCVWSLVLFLMFKIIEGRRKIIINGKVDLVVVNILVLYVFSFELM